MFIYQDDLKFIFQIVDTDDKCKKQGLITNLDYLNLVIHHTSTIRRNKVKRRNGLNTNYKFSNNEWRRTHSFRIFSNNGFQLFSRRGIFTEI